MIVTSISEMSNADVIWVMLYESDFEKNNMNVACIVICQEENYGSGVWYSAIEYP